jgi:hypothetical protein
MPRRSWWSSLSPAARKRSRHAADCFSTVDREAPRHDLRWLRSRLSRVEADLVRRARGRAERRECRRRAAECYLQACLTGRAAWSTSAAALRRLETLGYTNLDRRIHFAVVLGRYAPRAAARVVLARLRGAIRGTKTLPRRSPLRREYVPMMEELLSVWQMMRRSGGASRSGSIRHRTRGASRG